MLTTLTAKLKILPDDTQQQMLMATMRAYTAACNYVSEDIWQVR